ncbi:MAG TPA: hypothetical protein VLI92_02160 [Candidatus Saccharimonadales bacterium]|nr:hypothetical protein [Candidatus Saccharimonadales bacterium]
MPELETILLNTQLSTNSTIVLNEIKYLNRSTSIVLKSTINSTKLFPQIDILLQQEFPQVLKTQCFNHKNLPFCEEVHETEIGHLLEHIIIAHLFESKRLQGLTNIIFDGETSWNWLEDEEGTFYITIKGNTDYLDVLSDSILKSVKILLKVISSN